MIMQLQPQGNVSPISVASQNGHADVVDLLVQAGADIHRPITEVGDVLVCLCSMCSMGCNCVVNVSVYASFSRFLPPGIYNYNNKGSVLHTLA